MPPKLKKPKKREVYLAPKPKKPTIWSSVVSGLGMLRHCDAVRAFRNSRTARRIKNPTACIVAPVYAAVEKFRHWSPGLLENVFEVANEVHRTTLQQLKLRANSCYPLQCVCPTFLLNYNKVTILVRPCPTANPVHGGITSSLEDDQIKNVEQLLGANHGVVLQCAGRTFAFWKEKDKYFALVPEGFGSVDNVTPVLLKSQKLQTTLEHTLRLQQGVCNLYSVKVLSKSPVPMSLVNINAEFEAPELPLIDPVGDKEDDEPPEEKVEPAVPDKKGKPEEPPPPPPGGEGPSEDMTLSYSADYKEISEDRGILTGKEYCKEPGRIVHTLTAAAIFLYHFPAYLWTSAIIRDIMRLGKTIYFESEDENLLEKDEWTDRIKVPIKFMRKNFSLSFEKLVFGRVLTTEKGVLTVEQGLMKFFEGNDTGILVGPQVVLVWQQKNNYFMFDPKERDGIGRKWTRMYSAELGSTALSGSACVTWYRHPKKLAEVYIDSITLKHRKDPYRIVKIRVYEQIPKVENMGQWMGMSKNRWILVGSKTLCDYSYADDPNRTGKAISIAVAALMHGVESSEADWGNNTIDDVLVDGLDIFKQSLAALQSADPPVSTSQFDLSSVKKVMNVGGRNLRFSFVECMSQGPMLGEPKTKENAPLKLGLTNFFDAAQYGIFKVNNTVLAVWRGTDNYFYLYYPYEKLFGFPAQCTCPHDATYPPMGLANATRFKTIPELYTFLTSYLNTKENDEYCLSTIDIRISESADRAPLNEYKEFGVTGGVLRPYNDLHEGSSIFGVRADKQTLANLLVALGFNRINTSIQWNSEDMVDILNLGDKMFCRIFMNLPECQSRDYQLQWTDVLPVIGMNKFKFTRDPKTGFLNISPEAEPEGEEEMLNEDFDMEVEEGIEAGDDELFVRPQLPSAAVAEPKDLKGILTNWDKKKSEFYEAVLETDFYKVAIWKRDDLYFIFDPKASGENGELTERRIEVGRDAETGDSFQGDGGEAGMEEEKKQPPPILIDKRSYTGFDNEGSAYTAWFGDFDEFLNHLSAKTPEEFQYGKFTLHELVLTSEPLHVEDFQNQLKPGFRPIDPTHLILRGSMTKNNPSLSNRNKLEFSNSLVAIAFASITPPSKMSTTLLDVMLKYGDRLYSKSLNALKKVDKAKFCDIDKLRVENLTSMFSIYKINFNWKISKTVSGNLFDTELKKALGKLPSTVESGTAFILEHKGYVMSFWRSEGGYYMYDPFETNPLGKLVENGLPSLSRFPRLDGLINYLMNKYICISLPNTFKLHTIAIKSIPVQEHHSIAIDAQEDARRTGLLTSIPQNQILFQPYQDDMRILKSQLITDNLPQHSLALAALVHSRLQYVELWGSNISQRILFLSKYILMKSDCEVECKIAPISFDDIRSTFTIDKDILCHIVFSKIMQGPIYSLKRTEIVGVNLKNALTMFFRNCQHVVITMPGFNRALSIWKENGRFYLFGIDRSPPEIFVVASKQLTPLFDIILKDTNPEADINNWYELRSVVVTTVPIKEGICKPPKYIRKIGEGAFDTLTGEYYFADSKESHFYDHVAEKLESTTLKQRASEFIQISKGIEVLYSHPVLSSHRFFGTKDLFPSLQAACVETSALSQVKSPSLWTKKTLEKILTAGINLYINTVAVKGTSNLNIVDFRGNLIVSDCKLEVCPLTPTVQGPNKDDLLMCLTWILRKYQTAYFYTENFCFALIMENNDCFLYYPGSSERLCEPVLSDCSCLIRFCTISDLLDKILSNVEISTCENIYIGPICVFKH